MAAQSPTSPTCSAIDNVLHRLSGVKKNGSGYTALCPAHNDTNPSLSIKQKDGKVLMYCHAGCPISSVIVAIGLEAKDLSVSNNGASKPEKVEVSRKEYFYTDETGDEIAKHPRIDYDDGTKEMWWETNGKKGLGGKSTTDLPLYGLGHAMAESDDSTRDWILTEGEKCADVLNNEGYLALGTGTGAGTCPVHLQRKWDTLKA